MTTTTADELAEQLSNDGHSTRVSDIDGLVVIDGIDGRVGLSDIPTGWKMAAAFDDGEIHLIR